MTTNGNGTTLTCIFPGCTTTMDEARASIPSLSSIRKATGKALTVEELPKHVLCKKHASLAQSEGVKTFSYKGSVKELERRASERAKAGKFFQLYAAFRETERSDAR